MPVKPELLAHLVCPLCRGSLRPEPDALVCRPCRRRYPVVDGVPWLVPEKATKLPPERR